MTEKLSKLLHSRFFLGSLCIVLEFVQLIAVFILMYEFVPPITVLAWVFYIGVVLYLINRDEIPEFKIPWLMILLLLPVLGAFVFVLLSSNETSKRQYKRYETAEREMTPYLKQTDWLPVLREQNADAYLQANYLHKAVGMPCFGNSKTSYFPLGEDFHAALLADLRKAKAFIFMEYFIVQEGTMWDSIHEVLKEKAMDGVSVYGMYDDFGCIGTLPEHYYRQLCEEGIHCVPANKFKPVLSHIHNNRDHRKITVIDGEIGYTGGVNLADEYINAITKYGHRKDTAVRIEGEAAKNLSALFVTHWNTQSDEHIDCASCMLMSASPVRGRGVVIPCCKLARLTFRKQFVINSKTFRQ